MSESGILFHCDYADGTVFEGDLTDGSFGSIDMARLATYSVTLDAFTVALDITNGTFTIGDQHMRSPQTPPALRLVSYALVQGAVGRGERIVAFVVGWQSTIVRDGKPKNVRLGVKCDLLTARWELTEAI
jgi:hypothetical protein